MLNTVKFMINTIKMIYNYISDRVTGVDKMLNVCFSTKYAIPFPAYFQPLWKFILGIKFSTIGELSVSRCELTVNHSDSIIFDE